MTRISLGALPPPVWDLWTDLGAETVLVGGSVRDLCLRETPHDWDLATPLTPDAVERHLRSRSERYRVVPTGAAFGTVTVLTDGVAVEVTTFRQDGPYPPSVRRPTSVRFTRNLRDDLARRDFTINAMALTRDGDLIDPFGGLEDLRAGVIRAVGEPQARLDEDPLRLWRAVRFLGLTRPPTGRAWRLAEDLADAIPRLRWRLVTVSRERQRDEILRLLTSPGRARALRAAEALGLLGVVWPEFVAAVGFRQNQPHQHHLLSVHLRRTAEAASTLPVALAGLLHDIAKPAVKVRNGRYASYPRHAALGAAMTADMLARLRLPRQDVDHVTLLVREHPFPWESASDAELRGLVRRLGLAASRELLALGQACRIARGGEDARSLADVEARLQQASEDAAVPLAISGHDIMAWRGLAPGPTVGRILAAAVAWVQDDPSRNTKEQLAAFVRNWREQPERTV